MQVLPNVPLWVYYLLPLIVLWDLTWRGLAMWRAARRGEVAWFVCLIIFNTVGILPILYLLLTKTRTRSGADVG